MSGGGRGRACAVVPEKEFVQILHVFAPYRPKYLLQVGAWEVQVQACT